MFLFSFFSNDIAINYLYESPNMIISVLLDVSKILEVFVLEYTILIVLITTVLARSCLLHRCFFMLANHHSCYFEEGKEKT